MMFKTLPHFHGGFRRLLSAVLVCCIIITSVPFVFADDDISVYSPTWIQIDGNIYYLEDDVQSVGYKIFNINSQDSIQFFIQSGGTIAGGNAKAYNSVSCVIRFYVIGRPASDNNYRDYPNFDVSITNAIGTGSLFFAVNEDSRRQRYWYSTTSPNTSEYINHLEYDSLSLSKNILVRWQSLSDVSINKNVTISKPDFGNYPPASTQFWIYWVIDDVNISQNQYLIFNYMMQTYVSPIYQFVTQIYNLLNNVYSSYYSISTLSYDSDGNAVVDQTSYRWHDALIHLLESLTAPVIEQAEQEQKAKDAGALDAMDDALDAAEDARSFWDLIDFVSIVDMGDYDGDALGDQGSSSILSWFSQQTYNDLVNPNLQTRNDLDIIDFYHEHIYEIENILGEDENRGTASN